MMDNDKLVNPCVAQLIDANLDRAREGIRVIEEWCRFNLTSKDIVISLKDFRQTLGLHHHWNYKRARSTAKDNGIGLSHPYQETRTSSIDILAANFSRIQEALRVIEEFARIVDPNLSVSSAKIRYSLYDLETKVIKLSKGSNRRLKLNNSNLYLITNHDRVKIKTITNALEAGVRLIQFRLKEGSDKDKLIEAKKLASICKDFDALLIINDRIDIALACDADGIHIGQEDLPTSTTRSLIGEDKLIGKSTHTLNQLSMAESEGCDYVGVGPVNQSKTKPKTKALGTTYLEEAIKISRLPCFAIGGINNLNLHDIVSAGATKIAVCNAIMNASDPFKTTKDLMNGLK